MPQFYILQIILGTKHRDQLALQAFFVSLSVPSFKILYFSFAFSVSILILPSMSLALSDNFSFAPVNSLIVESLSFFKKLNDSKDTLCRLERKWSDFLPFYQAAS